MSSSSKKRPALGKGLSALLESSLTDITSEDLSDGSVLGSVALLPITSIEANPFNPRTHFEEDALNELKDSIATHGIIQPITVRKLGRSKYQLISGERRFKASQLAGLTEIPAYIRVANDQTMLEMALVENIQRQDLNAIEVALSYHRLIQECNLTQEQLAQQVSKSRTSITNHLRLLKLPAKIQLGVRENEISMGHARALVSIDDEQTQIEIFERVIEEQLSVRDLENILREEKNKTEEPKKKEAKPSVTHQQNDFTQDFSDKVAAKVQIKKQPTGNGKLIINFNSEVDLNRIIEILNE
ncbi:ParB/RepB/Spo0J family partition protein [Brumimicrobium glaciale]|jgi:ParB family chromosome partitioning protein|uniref:ParB/RepB/Spo0J family partition protein n=1 Tax=Brumimicrobium glaciale TaxID=200475 RepID=A0A4Q4KJC2_9FLAO|nr:ParB/RepB/Spo0J family partition protein [Brumimicrobium glaciale]RYM33433.1 ParB/RepB/Spo0J family partition protein [Brumimicrobium glaciale]